MTTFDADTVSALTPAQKAAVLIASVEQQTATTMLNKLEPHELKSLMRASRDLGEISHTELQAIVDEFEQDCQQKPGLQNSSERVRAAIESSVPPESFSQLVEQADAAKIALSKRSIWEHLEDARIEELCAFLEKENLHIAAFIVSRLPPACAAKILELLEADKRKQVVAGMMTVRAPDADAIAAIEDLVTSGFSHLFSMRKSANGQQSVAGVLNELDAEASNRLFEDLASVMPDEKIKSIKSLIFQFEDIELMEKSARSTLFDQVATDITSTALHGAEPSLIESVLSSLGQRTRRMLEADLKSAGSKTADEVRVARKQISAMALQLSSQNQLKLPQLSEAA
ncbi:MAG: FliG C-terminal domain-containing protein [Pseudomonadota bacterium]